MTVFDNESYQARIDAIQESDAWTIPDHVITWFRELGHRLARDMDLLLIVTGEEGVGKSTLALWLGVILNPDLDLDWIFNDTDDFVQCAGDAPPKSTLILDEAFQGAMSRRSMSQKNVDFITWLGEARALSHAMIVCFPRYLNLDQYVRQHRAAYHVLVPDRGVGIPHKIESNPFQQGEPWHEPVTRLGFPTMEDDPAYGDLWAAYQEQKRERIRDRTRDLGRRRGNGKTRGEIKKGYKKGITSMDDAILEFVANDHVRDEATAREILEAEKK